uniref:Uncharacterized protein n=1 Tax=viral metagenome TaxID=1070528 RepID=A0A6C0KIH2_9ZZZZ
MNNNQLKNFKYQTLLLNNQLSIQDKEIENNTTINAFLEREKLTNKNAPWSKLNKSEKIKILYEFAEEYCIENTFNSEQINDLKSYLKTALERKKIQRIKDINYDKITGKVKSIPGLVYSKLTHKFTLKNTDKKQSTVKNLPSKKKLQAMKKKKFNKNDKE